MNREREEERASVQIVTRLVLFGLLFAGLLLIQDLTGLSSVGGGLAFLVSGVVSGWALLRLHGRSPGALGFHLAPSVPRECALGLLLGLGMALLVSGLIGLFGGLRWELESGTGTHYARIMGQSFAFFLVPAAAEEALMRGYPLQLLAERLGPASALTATSVVFALLHWGNPSVGPIGIVSIAAAGFFLGVVYLKTGSLWWASAAHLGWNWALGFWSDLPVSGLDQFDAPYIAATSLPPDWLSGGAFGPEGSVVAAIALTGAAVVLWRASWIGPEPAAIAHDPIAPIGRLVGRPSSRASHAS